MTVDKNKVQIKYKLNGIAPNQCRLFDIKGEKIVICNEKGEFTFYKIKPLKEKE